MLLDAIRSQYQFSRWANHRILEAAFNLTVEQSLTIVTAGYLCLRDILVHTMSWEWIWLSRWKGVFPRAEFEPNDFPKVQAIQARWTEIEQDSGRFIDQLNSASLAKVTAYVNERGEEWAYPLWQQLIHQADHATYHRSEVATMLTRFGCSPGDLAYLIYQDEISPSEIKMRRTK